MDLTLTEEKMVAWVFEVTFEVRVYTHAIHTHTRTCDYVRLHGVCI